MARIRIPITIPRPRSEEVTAGGDRRLIEAYHGCILGTWWVFPVGEVWNQASVPWIFKLVVDEQSLSDWATLGHDELYNYHGALPRAWLQIGQYYRTYTRAEADTFLHRTAVICGCAPWRASGAAAAVRGYWWAKEAAGLSMKW